MEQGIQDKPFNMISEVKFVIQWIMAGRNQEARCRADRTGTYTLDMKLIEAIVPD
ncbi:hypothetical protein [Domibacillus iocasae]|uniref:hypothetical protein n=1 Tax=Domibacillus iocasae TaxID=1714016 RepID=UPI001471D6D6|nr:hypothetical protein [Domibacillus iocasae]